MQGWQFDPLLLQSTCQIAVEQDTELHAAVCV